MNKINLIINRYLGKKKIKLIKYALLDHNESELNQIHMAGNI